MIATLHRVYYRLHSVVRELLKFGTVGALAFVVDVGVFNLARLALELGPLTSKTLSVVVATTVAYIGNRHWTFRERDRQGLTREYVLFFLLNAIGLLISLLCLAVAYYGLGLTSTLAQNIAANGVGLALGTAFRFWSYRRFVFPELEDATEKISEAYHDGEVDPVIDLRDSARAAGGSAADTMARYEPARR